MRIDGRLMIRTFNLKFFSANKSIFFPIQIFQLQIDLYFMHIMQYAFVLYGFRIVHFTFDIQFLFLIHIHNHEAYKSSNI